MVENGLNIEEPTLKTKVPERDLLTAILFRAIEDLKWPRYHAEAKRFFHSKRLSNDKFFSFLDCCDLLDLESKDLLKNIDFTFPLFSPTTDLKAKKAHTSRF